MWLKKGVFSLVAFALISEGAWADITITQLANEGAIISDGTTRVMIDGMVVEPYSVYGGLPEDAAAQFKQTSGPYADIDLALASHRHHDHNQPSFACEFMKSSKDTLFVSSSQVLGLMREKCRELVTTSPRVREIDPQLGEPQVFEVEGAKVTAFPLSHGVFKYATIQNYGHLIEIGGMKVLHIGDADISPEDFQTAGLDQVKLDVALVPFWFFRPGPAADTLQKYLNAQVVIADHIPPGEMEEIQAYIGENFPAVTILKAPLEVINFSSALQ
jgi:L-ascorbate metabolism protein UlaG (beta-lactamase superfamily)